jgi:hypothetical protein
MGKFVTTVPLDQIVIKKYAQIIKRQASACPSHQDVRADEMFHILHRGTRENDNHATTIPDCNAQLRNTAQNG